MLVFFYKYTVIYTHRRTKQKVLRVIVKISKEEAAELISHASKHSVADRRDVDPVARCYVLFDHGIVVGCHQDLPVATPYKKGVVLICPDDKILCAHGDTANFFASKWQKVEVEQ